MSLTVGKKSELLPFLVFFYRYHCYFLMLVCFALIMDVSTSVTKSFLLLSLIQDIFVYLSNPPVISIFAWYRPHQKGCGFSSNHALYSNIEGPYVASIHVVPELKAFSFCWWIFGAHQNCLVSWLSWKWGFNIHVITFCRSIGVVICRASTGTWCRATLACPIKVISTKTLPRNGYQV